MLSLRASNEGLPRPRVARAQEHDRRPRLFESFLFPECFFQQRFYLAFGRHRIEDVGVAVKLPVDEHLGECRPIGHLYERLPLGGLRQDVDEFIRVPVLVEKLHRLFREPAHRHLFGALAVDQNLVRGDFLVNFFLNGICNWSPPSFSAMNVKRGTMNERRMSTFSVHRPVLSAHSSSDVRAVSSSA